MARWRRVLTGVPVEQGDLCLAAKALIGMTRAYNHHDPADAGPEVARANLASSETEARPGRRAFGYPHGDYELTVPSTGPGTRNFLRINQYRRRPSGNISASNEGSL
jgi:hypothetical protein